jgi:hypothetical protein
MSGIRENTPTPPMEKGNNISDEEEQNALTVAGGRASCIEKFNHF